MARQSHQIPLPSGRIHVNLKGSTTNFLTDCLKLPPRAEKGMEMVKNAAPVIIAILPNGLTKIASAIIAPAFPSSAIDVEC